VLSSPEGKLGPLGESFAQPLLTEFCELFDPDSVGTLLAKSQKLGLRASNPDGVGRAKWVPQIAHNDRSKELCKGLLLGPLKEEGAHLIAGTAPRCNLEV